MFWAVSLLSVKLLPHGLSTHFIFSGVLSLLRVGNPSRYSALLPVLHVRATYIAFAEYQLSPSLISLSPLATTHPRLFQQTWVRSSSACYRTFNLAMARSPGFGSHPGNLTPR